MTSPPSILGDAAKANHLFDRLAETTAGAIKTREALFAELKAEVELQAKLEQAHLLPALRKHAKSRDLAEQAAERLRGVQTLLARVGREPMEGDAFPGKIRELKKAFQAHVRDDKSELLPALRKALSDEEANAVLENTRAAAVAAEKAEQEAVEKRRAEARRLRDQALARQAALENAKKEAAQKRRAAARRTREQAQARQAALDAADRAGRKAAADAAGLVRATSKAVRAPSGALAEVVAAGVAEAAKLTGKSAARLRGAANEDPDHGWGMFATQRGELDHGVRSATSEWLKWARTRAGNQFQGFAAILRCRTPQELVATQTRLIQEDVTLLWESGAKIFGIANSGASLPS